jgi:hypothetical protein
MAQVLCPDGSIAQFPDDMGEEEIAAILKREFLEEPRPTSLEPGEVARRRNGASITFSTSMARYVVRDSLGAPRGFRSTLDEALDFADNIPSPPPLRGKTKPAPLPAADPIAEDRQTRANVDRHISPERKPSTMGEALGDHSAATSQPLSRDIRTRQ